MKIHVRESVNEVNTLLKDLKSIKKVVEDVKHSFHPVEKTTDENGVSNWNLVERFIIIEK